jgi:hypothetical protein
MNTMPITTSGQMRCVRLVTGLPSIRPARTPSSTYVAGDRCERTCIQGGRIATE